MDIYKPNSPNDQLGPAPLPPPWLSGRRAGWLAGWLAGCLAGWPAGWLAGWLSGGWLAGASSKGFPFKRL